jgi:hypothetical protein
MSAFPTAITSTIWLVTIYITCTQITATITGPWLPRETLASQPPQQ